MTQSNWWLVIGPPGCGKTTWLSKEVQRAVESRGTESVLITSLTRTAASEVAGRGLPIPAERIGTLHAHAFRALNHPDIAESDKKLADWNSEHPRLALTVSGNKLNDDSADAGEYVGDTEGDKLFQAVNLNRARMIPEAAWLPDVRAFYQRWQGWKNEAGLMDFTDLIEYAARQTFHAPGKPEIIFVDEAQDHDALELSLLERWGDPSAGVDRVILVGDPDQNLYEWRGSDPLAFSTPEVPSERRRVLSRSYRVPVAVHASAVSLIQRVKNRLPVEYHPTDRPGKAASLSGNYQQAPALLRHAKQYLDEGKEVMFLTACGYQLSWIIRELREKGIPFWNPYRRTRGDWNPLRKSGRGLSASQRLLAYMRPAQDGRDWTREEFDAWSGALVNIFRRGVKDEIGQQPPEMLVGMEELEAWFRSAEDIAGAYDVWGDDLDWFESRLAAARRKGMEFPLAVARQQGPQKLEEKPQVIVGTIHSVKGGEADVVYLFPDLSQKGYIGYSNYGSREWAAIHRQFYVGMTRAKDTLFRCAPATKLNIAV